MLVEGLSKDKKIQRIKYCIKYAWTVNLFQFKSSNLLLYPKNKFRYELNLQMTKIRKKISKKKLNHFDRVLFKIICVINIILAQTHRAQFEGNDSFFFHHFWKVYLICYTLIFVLSKLCMSFWCIVCLFRYFVSHWLFFTLTSSFYLKKNCIARCIFSSSLHQINFLSFFMCVVPSKGIVTL